MTEQNKSAKNSIPPYKEGWVTVQLNEVDLKALVALLSLSRESFAKTALASLDAQDSDGTATYTTRARLAGAFADKFAEFVEVGEPTSRESH